MQLRGQAGGGKSDGALDLAALDDGHNTSRDRQCYPGAAGQIEETVEMHVIKEQLGQQMLGTVGLLDAQVFHVLLQGGSFWVGLRVAGTVDRANRASSI